MACAQIMDDQDLARFRTKLCQRQLSGSCEFNGRCQYSHSSTKYGSDSAPWSLSMTHQRRCPFLLLNKEPLAILRYVPIVCNYASSPPSLTTSEVASHRCFSSMTTSLLTRECPRNAGCPYSHSLEEVLYHPLMYKQKYCLNYLNEGRCSEYYCPFVHSPEEKRNIAVYSYFLAPSFAKKLSTPLPEPLCRLPVSKINTSKLCRLSFEETPWLRRLVLADPMRKELMHSRNPLYLFNPSLVCSVFSKNEGPPPINGALLLPHHNALQEDQALLTVAFPYIPPQISQREESSAFQVDLHRLLYGTSMDSTSNNDGYPTFCSSEIIGQRCSLPFSGFTINSSTDHYCPTLLGSLTPAELGRESLLLSQRGFFKNSAEIHKTIEGERLQKANTTLCPTARENNTDYPLVLWSFLRLEPGDVVQVIMMRDVTLPEERTREGGLLYSAYDKKDHTLQQVEKNSLNLKQDKSTVTHFNNISGTRTRHLFEYSKPLSTSAKSTWVYGKCIIGEAQGRCGWFPLSICLGAALNKADVSALRHPAHCVYNDTEDIHIKTTRESATIPALLTSNPHSSLYRDSQMTLNTLSKSVYNAVSDCLNDKDAKTCDTRWCDIQPADVPPGVLQMQKKGEQDDSEISSSYLPLTQQYQQESHREPSALPLLSEYFKFCNELPSQHKLTNQNHCEATLLHQNPTFTLFNNQVNKDATQQEKTINPLSDVESFGNLYITDTNALSTVTYSGESGGKIEFNDVQKPDVESEEYSFVCQRRRDASEEGFNQDTSETGNSVEIMENRITLDGVNVFSGCSNLPPKNLLAVATAPSPLNLNFIHHEYASASRNDLFTNLLSSLGICTDDLLSTHSVAGQRKAEATAVLSPKCHLNDPINLHKISESISVEHSGLSPQTTSVGLDSDSTGFLTLSELLAAVSQDSSCAASTSIEPVSDMVAHGTHQNSQQHRTLLRTRPDTPNSLKCSLFNSLCEASVHPPIGCWNSAFVDSLIEENPPTSSSGMAQNHVFAKYLLEDNLTSSLSKKTENCFELLVEELRGKSIEKSGES